MVCLLDGRKAFCAAFRKLAREDGLLLQFPRCFGFYGKIVCDGIRPLAAKDQSAEKRPSFETNRANLAKCKSRSSFAPGGILARCAATKPPPTGRSKQNYCIDVSDIDPNLQNLQTPTASAASLFHQAFQKHRRRPHSWTHSNASVQRPSSWKFEQVRFHVLSEKKSAHVFQPTNGGRKHNHLNWPFAPCRRKR